MKQRQLTDTEFTELQNLRSAVYRAERARNEWLMRKGYDLATLKAGDEIWDCDRFCVLGIVTDVVIDITDDGPVVDYWFRKSGEHFVTRDTRGLTCRIGTKKQALDELRVILKKLEN